MKIDAIDLLATAFVYTAKNYLLRCKFSHKMNMLVELTANIDEISKVSFAMKWGSGRTQSKARCINYVQ